MSSQSSYEILSTSARGETLLIEIKSTRKLEASEIENISSMYLKLMPNFSRVELKLSNEIEQEQEIPELVQEDSIRRLKEEKQRQLEQELALAVRAASTKKKTQKQVDPSIVYGSLIKKKPKAIELEEDENSYACYIGEVFAYDERITRKGSKIVSFSLVEKKAGVGVKLILSEKQQEKYKPLKNKMWVKVYGSVRFDDFSRELVIFASAINMISPPVNRNDFASKKRIELKAHSNMSQMSGVDSAEDIIKTVAKWGHTAIAITDEDVIQAYPSCMAMLSDKKSPLPEGFKLIYGLDAAVVDDKALFVDGAEGLDFLKDIVVFDLETTGLSSTRDEIIEIGAQRLRAGEVISSYSVLVKPKGEISQKTIELTGIDASMLLGKPSIEEVLPEFIDYCEGSVLVAHNASFDVGFVKVAANRMGLDFSFPVLDTLYLSRILYPEYSKHGLNDVSKRLGVDLTRHHRADADVSATGGILLKMFEQLALRGVGDFNALNVYAKTHNVPSNYQNTRMSILIKDESYIPAFYKMISDAHLYRFYRKPLYAMSDVDSIRPGILLGSGGTRGEVYQAINSSASDVEIEALISKYDYVEIEPPSAALNSSILNKPASYNNYVKYVHRLLKHCKNTGVLPIAVSNSYYIDAENKENRAVLMYNDSNYRIRRRDGVKALLEKATDAYLRTTDELLDEFSFLNPQDAYDIVVENSNSIAGMIPQILPIPNGKYPPVIEGADVELKKICYQKAHEMYGDELPELVAKRLDRELSSIIGNGYAVMYIVARKLVLKSNEDGYLVGSRGSVGSSFAATMSGITEVNPLPPHYYCTDKHCDYVEFYEGNDIIDGFDLPRKICPKCAKLLKPDGHNIPFETFLGFDGDKEPDIDLNFAGPYQSKAHDYTAVLFGDDYVFKAGTISTVKSKKAYGYIKQFAEETGIHMDRHSINKRVDAIDGAKNTTGQHPGGLMVVPNNKSIYDFSPIQYPSNDPSKETRTTHFDYHSISGRILKLDILGHDAPTIIKLLEESTGFSSFNIEFDDKDTMMVFSSNRSLNIKDPSYDEPSGALGIPEFGTSFVRGILSTTLPTTFVELAKICGVAHGTNVWNSNAEDLIKAGTCTLMESICVRDEIMTYLIKCGLDNKLSFEITEKVRKGKGLTAEFEEAMRANNVPEWYIESCKKISYMFPLAHSVAYVMMSFRIAYYKVNYPLAFYASYFSSKIDSFDAEVVTAGRQAVIAEVDRLKEMIRMGEKSKDQDSLSVLELVKEMQARGFGFKTCDIQKSDAEIFLIDGDSLIMPFRAVKNFGIKAAYNLVEYRGTNEIYSVEDIKKVDGLNKTAIENLRRLGVLDDYPESSQFTLDMFL